LSVTVRFLSTGRGNCG